MHYRYGIISANNDINNIEQILLPYDENEEIEYNEEEDYSYNPQGLFDWYEIGGRFMKTLKVKEIKEDQYSGVQYDKTPQEIFNECLKEFLDMKAIFSFKDIVDYRNFIKIIKETTNINTSMLENSYNKYIYLDNSHSLNYTEDCNSNGMKLNNYNYVYEYEYIKPISKYTSSAKIEDIDNLDDIVLYGLILENEPTISIENSYKENNVYDFWGDKHTNEEIEEHNQLVKKLDKEIEDKIKNKLKELPKDLYLTIVDLHS